MNIWKRIKKDESRFRKRVYLNILNGRYLAIDKISDNYSVSLYNKEFRKIDHRDNYSLQGAIIESGEMIGEGLE